jgi:hypothetical protein
MAAVGISLMPAGRIMGRSWCHRRHLTTLLWFSCYLSRVPSLRTGAVHVGRRYGALWRLWLRLAGGAVQRLGSRYGRELKSSSQGLCACSRHRLNTGIIFCPNSEKKYGKLLKEIWSDFSVLMRNFQDFCCWVPCALWRLATSQQRKLAQISRSELALDEHADPRPAGC